MRMVTDYPYNRRMLLEVVDLRYAYDANQVITGLSFALILLFGLRFLPWLVIAPLAADIVVRGARVPFAAEIPIALIIGLTYGAAAAVLLSRRVQFDPTLSSRRSVLSLMGMAVASIAVVSLGHVTVLWLFHLVGPDDFVPATARAFVGDRLAPADEHAFRTVAPDTGAIVSVDGERFAAYRSPSGALALVSPVCTHMGCIVHWNGAEKSWDCPCHGSRFGIDGRVLEGPALAPLENLSDRGG